MKKVFATHKNVSRFLGGLEAIETPINGRIGMGLFFGPPGTGKTETAQHFADQRDLPYVRATDITSRRSLLSAIVGELGAAPMFRSDDLFRQAIDHLLEQPVPLIIDEIDYLVRGGMVEVLRDLNDMTNVPIILIGMQHADKKLRRFAHFFDRITAVVKFELLDIDDVRQMASQLCDVAIDDSGCQFIHQHSQGKLRRITMWFARAEKIARVNKLETVGMQHLDGRNGARP